MAALVSFTSGMGVVLASNESNCYVVLNLHRREIREETFHQIADLAAERSPQAPRLGVGIIVSYLGATRDQCIQQLRDCFRLAESHDLAVVVQLDGEQWWQARPDLWNWWDADQSGFDPGNASNVEWSDWGEEHALKIAWRNWGRQIRVLPPPNLMSPRYRAACHEAMIPLLEEILRWRDSLSRQQEHLFVGVKVGWESSIGVNAYHYPDGNELLHGDVNDDPMQAIQPEELPGRGFQPIGYAAVKTAGLADEGELQDCHVTEVVHRHLSDLAQAVRLAGFPREQVFTHKFTLAIKVQTPSRTSLVEEWE